MIVKRIFSYKTFITTIFLLCLAGMTLAAQGKICVVVGKSSNNKANKATVKNMFLGTNLNWPSGKKVSLIDQKPGDESKAFYSNYVKKSQKKVRKVWLRLILSGQMAKVKKCSDSGEVKAAVNKNPNAVGYLKEGDVDGSVKVLFKI